MVLKAHGAPSGGTLKIIITFLIQLYQRWVSPFLGKTCRFQPSCSTYTIEAIQKHGTLKGICLGVGRLLHCHPYCSKDIYDPVPERFAWRDMIGYKKRSNQKS